MEAKYAPEAGMVQTVTSTVLKEMIAVVISHAIHILDEEFVIQTGMEETVTHPVFLRTVTCLVTTSAIRLTVANNAIVTGTDLDARCFVFLVMTLQVTTCVTQAMAVRFAWTAGLGLSVRLTVSQPRTLMGITIVMQPMEVRYATENGLD